MDAPWWEVDLGQLCSIESIKVWNRNDDAKENGRHPDYFRARLFPFVVMVSDKPFSVEDRGQQG
jgi:hypothetical protein